jgi:hypothetical protein
MTQVFRSRRAKIFGFLSPKDAGKTVIQDQPNSLTASGTR